MKSAVTKWLCFSAIATGAASWAGVAPAQPETPDGASESHVVQPAQLEPTAARLANLKLPEGFQIHKWAEVQKPRVILAAPNGDVYVSQREPGNLFLLKDTNGDGRADVQKIVATRKQIHGLALRGNTLLFTTVKEIYAANRKADGSLSTPRLLLKNLPDGGQHPNRTLAFGPDGKLYISVGSTCNACDEPNEENATILRADANGKNRKIYASGLRNTIGFGWQPVSKKLFGWDNGMDTLGDDASKEELNEIKMGKRYGWPYIYENGKVNPHPLPPAAYSFEDWAKMSQNPVLTYTAHSAGLQMLFYTGNQFPHAYKNDAFVTLRGSWNRSQPSGYEVVRVRFNASGNPTSIEPFLTGFLIPDGGPDKSPGHIGRLVGLSQLPDGSLLVGDDTNNTIYRVSYGAKNAGRASTPAMDARALAKDLPETQSSMRGAKNSIHVASASFKNGGAIAFNHTAYGKNISPQLHWSGAPRGTKTFVLMMEDPIGVNPKPFVHWIVANIPARVSTLPTHLPNTDTLMQLGGAQQGSGSSVKTGYFGPKPPADKLVHQYHFQVFALNAKLNLKSGFNRQALLDAMRGHVLAKGETVGTYKRNPY